MEVLLTLEGNQVGAPGMSQVLFLDLSFHYRLEYLPHNTLNYRFVCFL